MAQASGSNAYLLIAKESVYGVAPTTGWEQVAMATYGETIGATTEELQSNAIKKGRGIANVRSGMKRAEGNFPIEFGSNGLDIILDGLTGENTGAGTVLDPFLWKRKDTIPSFSIAKEHTDINQYFVLKGYKVNTLELNFEPGQFVSGQASFLGKGDPTQSTTSTISSFTSYQHEAYTGIDAEVLIDDVVSNSCANLSFTISNELENQDVLGSDYAKSINLGRGFVTGNISLLFEDASIFTKWYNETRSDLKVRLTFNNEVVQFHFPKIKLNGDGVQKISVPNGLLLEMTFTSETDSVLESDFIITKYTIV